MTIIKEIDRFGRIVLPLKFRNALGINQKDSIKLTLKDNGIFLQKADIQPLDAYPTDTFKCRNFLDRLTKLEE